MTGKEPKWLNSREMKAWRAYIIASRRLLEALEQDLEDHDLSMPDYEVLAQLSEAPGRRMRMSELAEIAMVSKSRLSAAPGRYRFWNSVMAWACEPSGRPIAAASSATEPLRRTL